jgi:RND superfamily putative drug exporter
LGAAFFVRRAEATFDRRWRGRYKAGVFLGVGHFVARRPWVVVLIWVAAGAAMYVGGVRRWPGPSAEAESFLPAHAEQHAAQEQMKRAFPRIAARSRIAIIAQRRGGLKPRDFAYLSRLAGVIQNASWVRDNDLLVLAPAGEFLRERLVSRDGEAAMVLVPCPAFYASTAAFAIRDSVAALAADGRPAGLQVELTGMAAGACDFAEATRTALVRTTWVTVAAVVTILLLVYRSPVAAFVPVLAISACTAMGLWTLHMMGVVGWTVSDMERMFTIVLLYGAGTDFAMFWIARYREEWASRGHAARRLAAAVATERVGPAIVASAGTTILGLATLIATQMRPTHNAGKLLGLALCWAPLAGVTLVPAIASLCGRRLFWPWSADRGAGVFRQRAWAWLAGLVTHRPRAVLGVGVLVLLVPAVASAFIRYRYDTLSELPAASSSARGAAIAKAHFSPGQLAPVTVLVEVPGKAATAAASELAETITTALSAVEGVVDVYSLSQPFGSRRENPGVLATASASPFYWSPAERTLRLEATLDAAPFSRRAMVTAERLRGAVQASLSEAARGATVRLLGDTPYILEVRKFVRIDRVRVYLGASLVIWFVVALLVRRAGLSLFMVGATLLTFGATVGLSHALFAYVLGTGGLDYKVGLFVFVIVVAVGQDYNIFLVTRLRQETERFGAAEGVRRAVVSTGSVISRCGLIMAATLGSLTAGGLELLRQLGVALALGMLLDTFIVRPLLMPSFWLCAARWRTRGAAVAGTGAETPPAP